MRLGKLEITLFIRLPLHLAHLREDIQPLTREFTYKVRDVRALNFLLQPSNSLSC